MSAVILSRVATPSVSALSRSASAAVATLASFSYNTKRTFSTKSMDQLQRTALYEEHVKLGGKMVPYAGYALPVQYKDTVLLSHLHCRSKASVFDVSHMGQLRIWGDKRIEFLEELVVADLQAAQINQAKLSVLTTESGGVIDDCMITLKDDHIYMVVNAGCKEKDIKHIKERMAAFNAKMNGNLRLEYFSEQHELIAFQGPNAATEIKKIIPSNVDISKLPFMTAIHSQVAGVDCIITRCGYTGEDGFEISVPTSKTAHVFHALLALQDVLPAGLAVRDSLRLEAGLCLYGHELEENITPIEAGLAWLISKRRREQGGFLGFETISKQLKEGVSKKRVGFTVISQGPPARDNCPISLEDIKIGKVSSGTFSPSLNKPIGMAYVDAKYSALGTKLTATVRAKQVQIELTKMPFVPAKYYKVPL